MGCFYGTSNGELANLALVVYICLNHFTGISNSKHFSQKIGQQSINAIIKKVMQSYILIICTKYHSQNTQSNQSIITIEAYWQDDNNGFNSRLIINQNCII